MTMRPVTATSKVLWWKTATPRRVSAKRMNSIGISSMQSGVGLSSHMRLRRVHLLWILLLAGCDQAAPAPQTLPEAPAGLKQRVETYLEAAKQYPEHVWRDVSPRNADGTINGYIAIPRGESQKWEFRIPL